MGSLPSIGQTVFGDLKMGRTESSTEPFFRVAIEAAVVVVFDKLVGVVDASGSADVDVDGRTVEGD